MSHDAGRREFVKLCATAALAVGANPRVLAKPGDVARLYNRVRLVDHRGVGLTEKDVDPGVSYVFNYPYATTPCFLIDLGRPIDTPVELRTEAGETYEWPGGVGRRRSIVSFAAICAHKMSYPARPVSFINYRPGRVTFRDRADREVEREGVIYCCSEKSVYDPAAGARVLGGPAKQPLATILIQEGDGGVLYALGTSGGEMYHEFFAKFSFRLKLENRTDDVARLLTGSSEVRTIAEYSRTVIQC